MPDARFVQGGRNMRGMRLLVTSCVLVIAATAHAYAYVDPGAGSFFLQILVALLAGAMFYLTQVRRKIGEFLSRFRKKTPDGTDDNGGAS